METSEEKIGDVTVLTLNGRLDSNTAAPTEKEVQRLTDGSVKGLVIDCTNMAYVSSAGLRVLLIAAKRMKAAGCKLALAGLSAPVTDVFRVSGFLALFTIKADKTTAVDAVK
jgi:anti-anti-sigma factor